MVSPEAMVGETHGALLPGGIAAWGVPAGGCPDGDLLFQPESENVDGICHWEDPG